ncbi:hypothetical protein [Candidatus Magnetaquiglobus chichijimensis]|uniref:hypothetical protein n=1 Tax=Candidatus Magnetaquiglobus chichijimensis TaxID=3141448 RepID=UPI003B97CD3F
MVGSKGNALGTFAFRALFTISHFSRLLRKMAQAREVSCAPSVARQGNGWGELHVCTHAASGGLLFLAMFAGSFRQKRETIPQPRLARKIFHKKREKFFFIRRA